jgi:hypothetical protein
MPQSLGGVSGLKKQPAWWAAFTPEVTADIAEVVV